MTTTPGNIFVAGDAHVYLAPVGTTAPTDTDSATFNAALKEVGLFTEDSLKFSTSPSFNDVTSAQSIYATRKIENAGEATLEVDLQEWSGTNFQAVYGGGLVVETSPGSGIYKFTPPVVGGRQEKMCVVQVIDGTKTAVLVIPRCIQLEGVEQSLQRGSEALLPLRLAILGGSGDPFYWLDDDTASFAPAAATASAITPTGGAAAGGTPVLITGTGLLSVSGVTFGGVAATNVEAVSDTQLYATTPAHAAGAVNVVITNAGGALTKTSFYTYS